MVVNRSITSVTSTPYSWISVTVPQGALLKAFHTMLKGLALDYYYSSCRGRPPRPIVDGNSPILEERQRITGPCSLYFGRLSRLSYLLTRTTSCVTYLDMRNTMLQMRPIEQRLYGRTYSIIAAWLTIRLKLSRSISSIATIGFITSGRQEGQAIIWIAHKDGAPEMGRQRNCDRNSLSTGQLKSLQSILTSTVLLILDTLHFLSRRNTSDQCAACLNCFQYHCNCPQPVYKRNGGGQLSLLDPRSCREEASITKDINHKTWRFGPARNAPFFESVLSVHNGLDGKYRYTSRDNPNWACQIYR
jgi:hypothetical protein